MAVSLNGPMVPEEARVAQPAAGTDESEEHQDFVAAATASTKLRPSTATRAGNKRESRVSFDLSKIVEFEYEQAHFTSEGSTQFPKDANTTLRRRGGRRDFTIGDERDEGSLRGALKEAILPGMCLAQLLLACKSDLHPRLTAALVLSSVAMGVASLLQGDGPRKTSPRGVRLQQRPSNLSGCRWERPPLC